MRRSVASVNSANAASSRSHQAWETSREIKWGVAGAAEDIGEGV
jgi:hypothetical protein